METVNKLIINDNVNVSQLIINDKIISAPKRAELMNAHKCLKNYRKLDICKHYLS